jgi:AcrR family transcriptional regulator
MRTSSSSDSSRRTSTPGKREQNKRDKRERIREAAERLFVARGFGPTTTAAVAAEAGVATGTLFLYADDKVDLLFMVFNHRIQSALTNAVTTLRRDGPVVEQLAHLHQGFFDVYAELPTLGRELVANLCTARGRCTQEMTSVSFAAIGQSVAILRDGVARGEVDAAVDPYVAARNVFFLYYGALVAWLSGAVASLGEASDLFHRAVELQVRGFGPVARPRSSVRKATRRAKA